MSKWHTWLLCWFSSYFTKSWNAISATFYHIASLVFSEFFKWKICVAYKVAEKLQFVKCRTISLRKLSFLLMTFVDVLLFYLFCFIVFKVLQYCTVISKICTGCILYNTVDHRLNMELDRQSLFGLHVHSCTHWLRARHPPPPPPPHLGPYTRALLVSHDRRQLYVAIEVDPRNKHKKEELWEIKFNFVF